MPMRPRSLTVLASLVITIAACGGATPAPTSATPAAVATPTSTELKKTASGYPARAISFVVPTAAGGRTDILIRSLDKMALDPNVFPQTFTVSNVAGGDRATGD